MEVYIYAISVMSAASFLMSLFGSSFGRAVSYKLPVNASDMQKIKMRSFLAKALPFNRKILEKIGVYRRLNDRLDAAHVNLSPLEFFNLKILFIVLLFVVSIFAFSEVKTEGVAGAIVLGYLLPDIWLSRKIKKRKEEIIRVVPETVDLLGLCVEAGLDFTMAVKWVIEKTAGNPMIEELRFVLEEIKWGKSRSQALKDMSRRLAIPEVSSFSQTLVQAERMGTPVSEAFMILSEDTRMRRFHRGERFALKAPLKILIPLIFCILPVIGIIIGGPIILQFTQGNLLKGMNF